MSLTVNTKQLTLIQLIYTIFVVQWINTFKYISILPLVADSINILLISLVTKRKDFRNKSVVRFWNTVTLFILFEMFISIIQISNNGLFKGVVLMFWSIRMFFRPFLMLLCVERTFEKEDIRKLDDSIMPLNYLHLGISAIQYYIFNIRYDWNGGIFGALQGCNGLVNILYSVLLIYVVLQYFSKKRKLKDVVVIIVSSLLVAYWSELKFLYVEIIVLILLTFIINRPSLRSVGLIIGCAVLVYTVLPRMIEYLPENFSQMNSIEALLEYNETAYNESGRGYISRGNGFEIISTEINNGSFGKNTFGNGLGGGNSIGFLNIESTIEKVHGWRNYDYFSLTYIALEMGYVGIVGFVIIFLMLAACYVKIQDSFYKRFGILMIVITGINMWYNSSWIIDSTAYLLVFFLSIPLIYEKEVRNRERA